MKYYILIITIFCGIIYGKNLPPQIELTETEFDFGEVNQNMELTHTFKFKNTGAETLVVKNIRAP
ncbi:MAG: DUF1573 domain-containing protein [Candidatus Stahlbacteria bacterium]|nr:DUF1573 domain-containing protein [Candidatus Stahlbacteria bacterium]